ncbi:PIN domain-containing protein [Roseomonas stagni]|uniref:PIN domain-containing protein n=1 Tax=Falsiroseomonas algicola TaxID=2716930 RepID=A0A6M1LUD5_9PROT|nr:PIN domain-containing protein [Falsiroseomonas algicola]NGM24051.1 PIN domain-containing protein [Falsiroseomonas algicola]
MPNVMSSGKVREKKPTVFLDTNVIIKYYAGNLKELFQDDALKRFRYVVNPVVLQEIVLFATQTGNYSNIDEVTKNTSVAPLNMKTTTDLAKHVRTLRNRKIHSNDLLILGSASDCDYFVTDDHSLKKDWGKPKPKLISSAEFQALLDGKQR